MKRWKRSVKRSLSFLLTAAMIFTMMPQAMMQVSASEYQAEAEAENAVSTHVTAETPETTWGGVKSAAEIREETDPDRESGVDAGLGLDEDAGTGSETGSDEDAGTGSETGSDEGTGTDGGTGSDEGTGTDGGTGSGEGAGDDGEKNPGESAGDDEDADPGESDGTDEDMDPEEGDASGDESDPDGDDGADEDDIESEETDEEEEEGELEEGKLASLEADALSESDFMIDENGTLTAYTGAGGAVEIPDGVTAIGNNVFKDASITSITIPNSVTAIGENAFYGCDALEEVKLGTGLQSIGKQAFWSCTSLWKINLNDGLTTIGAFAFRYVPFGKQEITGEILYGELTIPSSVTSIGSGAFEQSKYLKTVVFEEGTAALTIGGGTDGVFKDCESLQKVTLPNRLKELPGYTFYNCSALEEAELGTELQSIGEQAFWSCTSLWKINLNDGLTTIGAFAFRYVPFGKQEVTGEILYGELTIPGSVTNIGSGAFEQSKYLKTVVFEEGTAALTIGGGTDGVFKDCESLQKVTLPNRLKELPGYTFYRCSALEEAELGTELQSIGEQAFWSCTSLWKINLNDGLTTIGASAFRYVPFGKQEVTGEILYGELTIPGSVTNIGSGAFEQSQYLGTVVFEEGTAALTIGDGVDGIFMNCGSLQKVTLPNRLKELPENTFYRCGVLEEAELGTGLQSIGAYAFAYTGLREVVLPDCVTTIGASAFYGCESLWKVELNEGLLSIGADAFTGAAFGRQETTGEITYGTVSIPGSVTEIGAEAFSGSKYLETVIFEDTPAVVLNMGARIFENCESLRHVFLPQRLKEIPSGMFWFWRCVNLEMLYIPASVSNIGDSYLTTQYCPALVIYGVRGSEAEKYANANNIPFNTEDALPTRVTGVSLNHTKITRVGESAIGSEFTLTATVKPGTAVNKKVAFTSSDEKIATVDAKGKVTIKDYGTVTITVTTEEGGMTASCIVTVLREWTEEEKEAIRTSLETVNASQLTVVTNVCPTVESIKLVLPNEYGLKSAEWRLPYSIADGRQEAYDVNVKKDGYQDTVIRNLAITGVTVEEISVSGASVLQNGKSTVLSSEVMAVGGELPADSYEIKWESAANSGVSLKENADKSTVTVTGTAKKTATVNAYLLLKKNGQTVSRNSSTKGREWFAVSTKITVIGDGVADRIIVTAKDKQGSPVEVDALRDLTDVTEVKEYQLSAAVYAEDELLTNPVPSLQWKSSNTGVAEVRAQGETAVLRVKAKGSAVISITANKNGGYTETFRVVVKDSMPRLEESSVTMSRYQEKPSAVIHLIPSNGYDVVEESLAVLSSKDGTKSNYNIRKLFGTEYQIEVIDTNRGTGKESVFVQAKTTAGEAEPYMLPLTISLTNQAPKVTVTQEDTFNLYDMDGEAGIKVSADAQIEEIIYTPSTSSGARLVQKDSDPEAGYFSIRAEGLTAANYKKAVSKGTLEITFKGYKSAANYKKTLTIKVNKNMPVIQAVPVSTVLYSDEQYQGMGLDTTEVSFKLKSDGSEINAEEGWQMKLSGSAPAGVSVTPSAEGDPLTVKFGAVAKNSVSLKFDVKKDNWIDGVKASCTIKKGKTPELGFSNSKIILNTAYDLNEYKPVNVTLFIKNQPENQNIRVLSIEGKIDAANKAKNDIIRISFEGNNLQVGIRDKSAAKNAKYTYIIKAEDRNGIQVSGNLDVTVTGKTAQVSYKQSGSIDLLNRAGTQIICKPTLKNYTDQIESVVLYGSYADRFSAEYKDGSIVIKAKEGRSLKAKSSYKMTLRVDLESGAKLIKDIKITPKQTNPKVKADTSKVVLFESAAGELYGKAIGVNVVKEGGPEISKIELTNGGDTFGYAYDEDGKGTLYVLPTASQKVNKTYKLKLAVRFKDGGSNAAPVYVTVSVNHRK